MTELFQPNPISQKNCFIKATQFVLYTDDLFGLFGKKVADDVYWVKQIGFYETTEFNTLSFL